MQLYHFTHNISLITAIMYFMEINENAFMPILREIFKGLWGFRRNVMDSLDVTRKKALQHRLIPTRWFRN